MKNKFNWKYLKTGGYSVLVSLAAIAIIIVLNLFVNELPATWTQFDMSADKMLTLGEATEKVVKAVDEDVNVYYVCQIGSEDKYISTLLDKYKALNSKIKVEQIDPVLNPNFISGDRMGVEDGGILVESEKRNKSISTMDIYYPGVTEDQLMQYYYQYQQMPQAIGFDLENLMTSAINYVTTDVLPIVYTLTGHGEAVLSDTYKGYFEAESMEVKDLNLASADKVPEDCDAIFINQPQKDISSDEATRLLDYLKAGGKMVDVSYYKYTIDTKFVNLQTVLDHYGVAPSEGVIYEGDSKAHYSQMPYMLLGQYGSHDIVKPLDGYLLYMGYSQGINISDDIRSTVTVTPLLSTTDKAYAKTDFESKTASKEEGDLEGPFDYAVAITETLENGGETQIVWVNSPMFVDSQSDIYGTIKAMFINSFAWMCDMDDSISIPYKTIDEEFLSVTDAQGKILSAIFMIVIPVAIIGAGFAVWFRRRSK